MLRVLSSRDRYCALAAALGALLMLGACGARTPAGSAGGRDDGGGPTADFTVDSPRPIPRDFGRPDFPFPPPPPPPDFGFPPPPPPLDFGVPPPPPDFSIPDFAFPDFGFPGTDGGIPGCLPVHPSLVAGPYKGKWSGTARVGGGGGSSGFPVNGTLQLYLRNVPGLPPGVLEATGTVNVQAVPIVNTLRLQGRLNCSNLQLNVISSGVPAKGNFNATLDNFSPLGFNKGQFFISIAFGGAFTAEAKGSWSAYK